MGLMDLLFRGVRREAIAAVPAGAVLHEGLVVGQGLAGGGPAAMKGNWVRVRFTREDGQEDAFAFDPMRGGTDPWVAAIGG